LHLKSGSERPDRPGEQPAEGGWLLTWKQRKLPAVFRQTGRLQGFYRAEPGCANRHLPVRKGFCLLQRSFPDDSNIRSWPRSWIGDEGLFLFPGPGSFPYSGAVALVEIRNLRKVFSDSGAPWSSGNH